MKVKTETLNKVTLDSMGVGDEITLILPDYSKVGSSRSSLSTYLKTFPQKVYTTSEGEDNPCELTITRLK